LKGCGGAVVRGLLIVRKASGQKKTIVNATITSSGLRRWAVCSKFWQHSR